MSPKVSIIIPVYNKSQWIEETLNSVANQSYKDWECIIIDDGSTDESHKVIHKFIEVNPGNWHLITQSNSGQCVARNRGIEKSEGEYIAFLDGDDTWAENKLDVQVKLLDANSDSSLVICPYRIYKQGESQEKGRLVLHVNNRKMLTNWLNLRGFGAGTESTGMARRNFLLSLGGFDTQLSTSAGLDLTLRLEALGKILTAKDTYMKYRIYTGQWHANLEMLSSDLEYLRQKHGKASRILGTHMDDKHDAYIFLQDLRQNFSKEKLFAISRRPRSFFYLMILALCILRRNSVARMRAFFPTLLTQIPKYYLKDLFS
ncbi:MAG TPA: glycosyltransferase family 2 protein [Candidatus Paceibacterota bacterium]|nr:glycosyltransferase family 2 protein [Candidatus Paceibacterota bacterium]